MPSEPNHLISMIVYQDASCNVDHAYNRMFAGILARVCRLDSHTSI